MARQPVLQLRDALLKPRDGALEVVDDRVCGSHGAGVCRRNATARRCCAGRGDAGVGGCAMAVRGKVDGMELDVALPLLAGQSFRLDGRMGTASLLPTSVHVVASASAQAPQPLRHVTNYPFLDPETSFLHTFGANHHTFSIESLVYSISLHR